ncbi:hypothetical protein JXO52_08990 [bacterium]|nr:hypothetical protein [bacterium]
MKRMYGTLSALLICCLLPAVALAQLQKYQDVPFFTGRHMDANRISTGYGEGMFRHTNGDGYKNSYLGAMAAMPFGPIEVALDWFYYFYCSDCGHKYSGAYDPTLYGKYNVMQNDRLSVSAGAYTSIPIGAEKVGAGNLDFGFWGAARYISPCEFLFRLFFGVGFYEHTVYEHSSSGYKEKSEYKNKYHFGGGVMKEIAPDLFAIGDVSAAVNTVTTMQATGGVEYQRGPAAFRASAGFQRSGYPDMEPAMWTNAGLFQFGVRVNF